jgi:thiosulfate/3-mercaptopyruvate sulfurtransferase
VTAQEYPCEFINESSLIDAPTLEAALDTETVIVDTRDPIEYDTVHISGAINIQWRTLIDDDRRQLHSEPECRRLLEDRGIDFDRPGCLYCNTARRLSFVYGVLRELDHDDVVFYKGGIAAWASHGGPVETTS